MINIKRVLDQLFRRYYSPEELIGKISKIISSSFSFERLTKDVLEELEVALKIDSSAVVLIEREDLGQRVIGGDFSKDQARYFTQYVNYFVQQTKTIFLYKDFKESEFKKVMKQNRIGVIVKLAARDKGLGFMILGVKRWGKYTKNDFRVLEVLSPQLSIAIDNSLRYEELKNYTAVQEEKIKKATSQLQRANQALQSINQQKDEFVSMAAHELRSPLTAIKGYLSMSLEEKTLPDLVKGYLIDANSVNDRLVRLVNNMLNVSRIEQGRLIFNKSTVDIVGLVTNIYKSSKFEASRKGLKLTLDTSGVISPKVNVDEDRLTEAIDNLVSNAVKYTQEGSVTIKVSNPVYEKIRVEVIDTGPGISKEEQQKLFEKFYRVESKVGKTIGTGLGLYISKLLIEKFGGKVGLRSNLGKGSNFWFELPTVPA